MEWHSVVFLAIFPLQMVLFPGEPVPLHIFEPRYKELIAECQDSGITFGIPTVINGQVSRYGTEVRLERILHVADNGEMDVIVRGIRVFEISDIQEEVPGRLYSGAQVEWISDQTTPAPKADRENAITLFNTIQRLLDLDRTIENVSTESLSWQLAPYIGLPLGNRVELLSIPAERKRVDYLVHHMERIVNMLKKRRASGGQVARRDYILHAGNRLN